MADTLQDIWTKLQNELDRADSTTLGFIKSEVISAIQHLSVERFPWNERKFASFNTVAGTQDYALPTTDSAAVAIRVIEIDSLTVTISNHANVLDKVSIQTIEEWTNNSTHRSHPYCYAVYNQRIWLYPIPNGTYAINGKGLVDINNLTSASAGSGTNAWLEEKNGEELVRTLARAKLLANYMKDYEAATEALGQHGALLARHRMFYEKRAMPDAAESWGF